MDADTKLNDDNDDDDDQRTRGGSFGSDNVQLCEDLGRIRTSTAQPDDSASTSDDVRVCAGAEEAADRATAQHGSSLGWTELFIVTVIVATVVLWCLGMGEVFGVRFCNPPFDPNLSARYTHVQWSVPHAPTHSLASLT